MVTYTVTLAIANKPSEEGAIGAASDTNRKVRKFVLQNQIDAAEVEALVEKKINEIIAKLSKIGTLFKDEE